MVIKVKSKYNNELYTLYKPIFELFEGDVFVYEDYDAFKNSELIYDCTLQIEIDKQCIQINVRDGRLQNLEKAV